jgi:hypothetical protein
MSPKMEEVVGELRNSGLAGLFNPQRLSLFIFAVALFALVMFGPKLFETNDAGYIKVLQKPITGTLTAYTAPGMFIQGLGDVTTYKAADVLYFSKHETEGRDQDDSIEVRFNDGATAHVTGNVRIELPHDPEKLIEIHKKFRSYDSLIKDTVKQVVSEATILTAALMTAEDSYTTKRAEFSQLADDQVRNGVFLTEAEAVTVKDLKSGETVIKQVVRIQRNADGSALRKDSVLSQYGIRISQFVIKEIDYERTVADQISAKQGALMQVVSAKANAERAIQDRLTAEEVGRKNVAVAKYEQEVEKAKAVTEAEKELEVAKLHRQAEEQNKTAMILKGEGEGEYRRKLMLADGALDKKLAAYVDTQKAWAEAFANSKNPVVPGVVMGGGAGVSGGSSNAATQLMEMMAIKAAKDLALNVGAKASN